MIEILIGVIVLLLIGIGFGAKYCYKVWNALNSEIERYEALGTSLHGYLNLLNNMCVTVLLKDIYSDDPAVRAFVNVLQDVQPVLLQIDEEFGFEAEPPASPKAFAHYDEEEEVKGEE